MSSMHSQNGPDRNAAFGAAIGGEADLDALLERLGSLGARTAELKTGPEQLVGLHLGAVPRHGVRDALAEAGITIAALAPDIELRSDHPDEGVVADIDEHLKLAVDVGAARLALIMGAGGPNEPARADVPGASDPYDRVSQRLTAVLARAAELKVQLVVENSGPAAAAGAAALASVLDTAAALAHAGGQVPPAGAIWNVEASIAAGEAPAESVRRLTPFLTGGRGYIRCASAEAAAALVRELPETAQMLIIIADASVQVPAPAR